MTIQLFLSNRPTKPGLYLMREHHWEAPRLVKVDFMHTAGESEPSADLQAMDSRGHTFGCSPLNEQRANGGKWQWFIAPEATFSERLTFV